MGYKSKCRYTDLIFACSPRRCPSSSSAHSPSLQRQGAAPTISLTWNIFPVYALWSLHPLNSLVDPTNDGPDIRTFSMFAKEAEGSNTFTLTWNIFPVYAPWSLHPLNSLVDPTRDRPEMCIVYQFFLLVNYHPCFLGIDLIFGRFIFGICSDINAVSRLDILEALVLVRITGIQPV